MQFKAIFNYGLRIVVYLSMNGGTCSSREIAAACDIPRDYLLQICQNLRKGGIISAQPGKNGGYKLARDASDITLLEVITVLENKQDQPASQQDIESLTPTLQGIMKAIEHISNSHDTYLDKITLQGIADASKDEGDFNEFNEYLANALAQGSEKLTSRNDPCE